MWNIWIDSHAGITNLVLFHWDSILWNLGKRLWPGIVDYILHSDKLARLSSGYVLFSFQNYYCLLHLPHGNNGFHDVNLVFHIYAFLLCWSSGQTIFFTYNRRPGRWWDIIDLLSMSFDWFIFVVVFLRGICIIVDLNKKNESLVVVYIYYKYYLSCFNAPKEKVNN